VPRPPRRACSSARQPVRSEPETSAPAQGCDPFGGMRSPRRLITVLAAALLLAPAGVARAGIFPGEVIDGPDPDLVRAGDVDLARDGTGAVVYVRKDGGVNHIFAAPLTDGGWGSPERVDNGLGDPGSQPVVAASDGGRLAIAFLSGGNLYAVVRPAGAPSM